MVDTRAASRTAPFLVYGAGLAQGLALVSFPAASSILTSPTGYDLSTAQYGLMFLPQVVLAITAAALSPVWAKRWSLQRVLQAGLAANLLAMLLLVASQFVASSAAAYPILLCATAALGFGFGCTVPALNTFAEHLDPARQDRSVLTLNALLGTGTALAPLLIALFLALGAWWLLPVLAAAGLAGFVAAALRVPLDAGPPPAAGARRAALPRRFWWYAAAVLLYGICETLFGNWSSLYLVGERGPSAQVASLSLAGQEFPRLGATSSGELIAGYQVGYGITAFGVAPLQALTGIGMGGIYLIGAGIAVALAVVARMVTAGRVRHPATP